jgi:hypothetical protein
MTDEDIERQNGSPLPDVRVAATHIDAYGRHVTVSTINRDSSAMWGGRYAETIVFDNTTNPRKILDMGEGLEGTRYTHDKMVLKWSAETIQADD